MTPNSESHLIFVRIDVSKDKFDVCIQHTRSGCRHHVYAYDDRRLKKLTDYLKTVKPKRVVMEATGGIERRVCRFLLACGLPVTVVNPRQVRNFAKSFNHLSKTDKIDVRAIHINNRRSGHTHRR